MVDKTVSLDHIEALMHDVFDPEVPVLSIVDLGVFRNVHEEEGKFIIEITPTYSGCPAMNTIEQDVRNKLDENGIKNYQVKTVLSPPWTTDWMSSEGRKKLREYGIAPPGRSTVEHLRALATGRSEPVACPFCNSRETTLTSAFGSTACKALHFCESCRQPFEEFKCH